MIHFLINITLVFGPSRLKFCFPETEELTMNRNQIILIVLPFLLIFGYQNCQKSSFDPATTPVTNPSESVSTQEEQTIVLAHESLQGLQFKATQIAQVPHGSTTVSVVESLLYSFDLANGEFHIVDQNAQTDVKYCLTENLKSQVSTLLLSSSICKGGVKVPEGQVCTQAIQEGYANIITNRDEFHLGSASDGCGSHSVDLCEGSVRLKDWFKSVQASLTSLNCGS
jgi:hypothetical protein